MTSGPICEHCSNAWMMHSLLRHIIEYQSLFHFREIETKLLSTKAFKKELEMIYNAKKILLIVSWYQCPEISFGSDCNKIPATPPWSPMNQNV